MSGLKNWEPIAREYDPLKAGSIDGTDSRPHDHAIERACQAVYFPNKKAIGDPKKTIFVARLNPKTSGDSVRKIFSQFGEIANHRLVEDIVTGYSKCYAFVEYYDERSACRAYRDGNKMLVDGSEIFVEFECERTLPGWIPRRLGGGFGGKKESGQLRFGGRDRPFRKPFDLTRNKRFDDGNGWNANYDRTESERNKRYKSSRENKSHRDY